MKKALLALVILALLLSGSWLLTRRDDGSPDVAAVDPGGTSVALVGTRSAHTEPANAPWLVQHGAPARRIAGHVRFRGAPVAGALVRLGNALTDVPPTRGGGRIGDELQHLKTGPDGSFDFGEQPAASFTVSAEAEGKTPASIAIALPACSQIVRCGRASATSISIVPR